MNNYFLEFLLNLKITKIFITFSRVFSEHLIKTNYTLSVFLVLFAIILILTLLFKYNSIHKFLFINFTKHYFCKLNKQIFIFYFILFISVISSTLDFIPKVFILVISFFVFCYSIIQKYFMFSL